MKVTHTLKGMIAAAAILAAGGFTGSRETHAGVTNPPPTEVVILGTLHGAHRANTNYSIATLQSVIVAMKPAAILVELPPEIGGRPTVRAGRVIKELDGNENTAANLAADALGVNVIPFDREGRNEFYQRTRYFARQTAASRRLNAWLEDQTRKDSNSIQVLALRLESEASATQNRFYASGGPELINSPAHDMVIATKYGMVHGIVPRMLSSSGERELAEEFHFLSEEWQERNQIMARNIENIAHQFSGKRLAVVTGSEHRPLLRDLLAKAPELEVKEFYELPGWTGTAPWAK